MSSNKKVFYVSNNFNKEWSVRSRRIDNWCVPVPSKEVALIFKEILNNPAEYEEFDLDDIIHQEKWLYANKRRGVAKMSQRPLEP